MKKEEQIKPNPLGMKNRALLIVGLLIAILAALFLYSIINNNKREIKARAAIFREIISEFFSLSIERNQVIYFTLFKNLLSVEPAGVGLDEWQPGILQARTRECLTHPASQYPFLLAVHWYSSKDTAVVRIPMENDVNAANHQYAGNPLARQIMQNPRPLKTYSGFMSGEEVTYRMLQPVAIGSNPPIAVVELVINPHHFLDHIDMVLNLEGILLIKARGKIELPCPKRLTVLFKGMEGDPATTPTINFGSIKSQLEKIDIDSIGHEVTFQNRVFLVNHSLDLSDFHDKSVGQLLFLQEITREKQQFNTSLYQIVAVTLFILVIAYLTIYFSFNKLLHQLAEREAQLKKINQELESEILEREIVEDELKTHRNHLEELIAEGTRELEIKSQEIETNEQKLRTITSSIQDAIIMMDHHREILFWNPSAERIFGYKAREVQGKDFLAYIVPPGSYQDFMNTFTAIKQAGEDGSHGKIVEVECKRKNGDVFHAELMASEVGIKGKSHSIAVLRDITKKKDEETEKRILLRAVEQSNVGIEISDTKGVIQYVNPKFTEITGFTREEVIGKRTNILKSNFNPEEDYKDLWDTITSGKDWQGELYNRKKNGDLYWDSSLISPIKDHQGMITHFVAIKEDITERKNMEIELLSAKESAEAASRSKGEFLANMSHEIRTPMNAIIGMTELTLGTDLNREQREYLDIVQQASRSLLKLLNDILDFSKVEAGKLVLDPFPFSLRKILGEITKTLAIQANDKNLELVYYIDSEVPDRLTGDASRLRQILVNLIGNSIKFTEEGEIVLKIEILEEGFDDKILLHFVISDTGIGIAENQLTNIFEKFAQADSSTTRKYGGTGLGLAISSKLVELMGGVIWAESPSTFQHFNKKGPGSTFHFTALFQLDKTADQGKKSTQLHKLQGFPLLIVDDNETSRRFLQEVLGKYGLKPEVAGSGKKALEILRSKPTLDYFQMLIIDFRMPEMDGGMLLEIVRRELNIQVPVILLTSGVQKSGLSQFKKFNANAHLLKPVNSQELLECMHRVLGYSADAPPTLNDQFFDEMKKSMTSEGGQDIHILVVEDNAVNQRLIKRLLEKKGYIVEIANDGKEAIEKFFSKADRPRDSYQLIFMDIQMPNMDGMEATRRIREKNTRIPIIALTAHAMKEDKDKFLSYGMNDYVSKPIEKRLLFETLEKYISPVRKDED